MALCVSGWWGGGGGGAHRGFSAHVAVDSRCFKYVLVQRLLNSECPCGLRVLFCHRFCGSGLGFRV